MSGVRYRSSAAQPSWNDSSGSEAESRTGNPKTAFTERKQKALLNEGSYVHVGRIAWKLTGVTIGLLVPLILGYYWSKYLKLLHENYLWFSNIGDLERDISFQSEGGLYYSYYKQLVDAQTWSQGMYSLTHDNLTEHPRMINIIERFNVFQEIITATLYRLLPIQKTWEPVYFYIDIVFGLHGIYLVVIYCTAWLLSGSWIAGLLSVVLFGFNRQDMTRVDFTIPLRESWAYPFIFMQLFFVTLYMKYEVSAVKQKLALFGVFLTTLLFVLFWQFAQFVLLPEVMSMLGVWLLGILAKEKIIHLYGTVMCALLTGCILQYGNMMVLGSIVLSFICAGFVVFKLQSVVVAAQSVIKCLLQCIVLGVSVLILTLLMNCFIKKCLGIDADQHIVNFVMTKVGLRNPVELRDFDVLLYACESSFQAMAASHWPRLTATLLLPSYILVMAAVMILLAVTIFKRSYESSNHVDTQVPHCPQLLAAHPETAYHVLLSVLFAIMALSTLRCKFLWLPHTTILTAAGISHSTMWKAIGNKLKTSTVTTQIMQCCVVIGLVIAVIIQCLPDVQEELKELQEFHDPDIMELMQWIQSNTYPAASFAGSMQLMASVKLCTRRHICNHPHYEDNWLRERTQQVYQIYGKHTAAEVHQILKEIDADFMIVEDSQCYTGKNVGCRPRDIVDIVNGDLAEGIKDEGGDSGSGRFCHDVQNKRTHGRFFRLKFKNNSFHLYKVIT